MPYIGNIVQDFSVNNAMLNSDSVTSIKIVDGTIEGADIAANLDLSDNQKIRFGTGNDLEIYHDGSHNIINGDPGQNLEIQTNAFRVRNQADSESMIVANADSAVELYFDNDRKFRTISSGCQVESTTGDTFLVVRSEEDNAGSDAFIRLQVENTSATSGVLFGDSADGDIGQIIYEHADNSMRFRTNTAEQWRITSAGHLENNNDTGIIKLGTADDLQIYHDGSESTILSLTGGLQIKDTGGFMRIRSDELKIQSTGNETYIEADANGAVQLFHDNSKKFETFANGVRATNNGNIKLASDSGKFFMGAGDDAELFHDGTNLILNGDGTNSTFLRAKSSENSIVLIPDGAVELYHNNSKKLETISSGIAVQGTLLDLIGNGGNTTTLKVRNATDTAGTIYGHSSNSNRGFIQVTESGADFGLQVGGANTANMRFEAFGSSANASRICSGTEEMITAAPNGAVELYFDNSKKFQTTSDGASVTNITNNNGLDLNGVGNNTCIRFMSTGSSPGHAYRINYHSVTNNIFNSPCISFDKTATNGNFDSHIGAISDNGFHFADNKKLHLGSTSATGDLQIYHNGTNSIISNTTGALKLLLNNDEDAVVANQNGAVELYHDNSKKAETTSTGLNVIGDINLVDNGTVFGGDDAANTLILRSASGNNNHSRIDIGVSEGSDNGGIHFYTAGSSVATRAMTIKGTTQNVGIGTDSPNKRLLVDTNISDSNHFVAEFTGTDSPSNKAASCNFYYMLCGSDDNRTGLYWEHQLVSNVRMWMDDSSNLRQSASDPTANNSGTAFSYAGGSDYRLKENVVDYTNGITELKQLKPYKFNYIETDRIIVDKSDVLCSGFYAHEAGTVVPSSLLGKKDEVDFEGNPIYQSLKYEKFVPLLTAALQEAIAKIETLETEVAALKAG